MYTQQISSGFVSKKDITINDPSAPVLLCPSTQQNVLNQLFDRGDGKDGNNQIGSLCESVIYLELFYYLYHKSSAVIRSNGDLLHDASQVGNTTMMHILHCIKKNGVSISVHMTICYKTNGGIKMNIERIDLNLRLFNCPRTYLLHEEFEGLLDYTMKCSINFLTFL